jgi:hypothetical protein
MSLLHSSTRRPSPLKQTDYDHEINLVDHERQSTPPRSPSASERPLSPTSPGISDSSSRRHSDVPLRQTPLLRKEITRLKYAKYQDRHLEEAEALDDGQPKQPRPQLQDDEDRGRPRKVPKKGKPEEEPESAIDVLYENQRGGFLCGMALFSEKALGNLDPSPWTNIALKTSATNITNAQVPDPSWEWAWKAWSINHTDRVDEDGWEYSFAFAKQFSWHGPSWWNSFVRRRAWTRKRVKKKTGYIAQEGHMLNEDYFTIHPAMERSRSRGSTLNGSQRNRYSIVQLAKRGMEGDLVLDDITDIASLMQTLRFCRIDREKTEAIESFIQHGGDELYYLRERMHEIMKTFIFQASRRLLLAHLIKSFDEASDEQKKDVDRAREPDPVKKKRLENLEAALHHADEEVKRLEFWSDVKAMAEKGESTGAVDESQGWGKEFAGLGESGPKDVITNRNLPGKDDCKSDEGNGTAVLSAGDKGKEKGKE